MPIDYVTTPGVGLTAACFSDNVYEDVAAQKCFSNLLAVGFRKFILDLYWDTSRQTWSLCPVELSGTASSPENPTSLTTSSSSISASASLTYATLANSDKDRKVRDAATSTSESTPRTVMIGPRQNVDTTSTSTAPTSLTSTTSVAINSTEISATSTASPTSTEMPGDRTLYEIGPYSCTSQIGLTNFTNVFYGHLKDTENSLNATFESLIINIHAAAPYDDPTASPQAPGASRLPSTGNYISQLLNSTLSSYIFTPSLLDYQRANLNATWYSVNSNYRPLTVYLQPEAYSNGDLYTIAGWPSESFIELQRALRFVAGIGSVDPQMLGYNFSQDADTLFPQGALSSTRDVSLASDGQVSSGCLYQNTITSFSALNTSWATSPNLASAADLAATFLSASNITSCGISPILNETLGTTANINSTYYFEYIMNTIWSWADNEPSDTAADDTQFSCAVVNSTNAGKWQVGYCGDRHYGACRTGDSPYNWTITNQNGNYAQMDDACGDDYFSVPRTALENDYLRMAIDTWHTSTGNHDATLFWINFNDNDVTSCWVSGVNSTCPYVEKRSDATRTVVVPTVAGVIVVTLALLLIFVKCAGNRQTSKKRRRRGESGWDYEGVPS